MGKYKGIKNKVQLFNPHSRSWTLVDTKIGGDTLYRINLTPDEFVAMKARYMSYGEDNNG